MASPRPAWVRLGWLEWGSGVGRRGLLRQRGREGLMRGIRPSPPLWQQVHMYEPRVLALVQELCTWPEKRAAFQAGELPEQQDDQEDQEEPVEQRKGARGRQKAAA